MAKTMSAVNAVAEKEKAVPAAEMQAVVVSFGNGASNASTVQAEPEVLDAEVVV